MVNINYEILILGNGGEKFETISIDQPYTHFIHRRYRDYVEGMVAAKLKEPAEMEDMPHISATVDETLSLKAVTPMFDYLGYNQKEIAEVLDVNASTLSRWKNNQKEEPLGKLQSKVVLEIDEVIAKGVKFFGSEEKLKNWLNNSNYALGDVKPLELLKYPFGVEIVDNAIEGMSWGNFV